MDDLNTTIEEQVRRLAELQLDEFDPTSVEVLDEVPNADLMRPLGTFDDLVAVAYKFCGGVWRLCLVSFERYSVAAFALSLFLGVRPPDCNDIAFAIRNKIAEAYCVAESPEFFHRSRQYVVLQDERFTPVGQNVEMKAPPRFDLYPFNYTLVNTDGIPASLIQETIPVVPSGGLRSALEESVPGTAGGKPERTDGNQLPTPLRQSIVEFTSSSEPTTPDPNFGPDPGPIGPTGPSGPASVG